MSSRRYEKRKAKKRRGKHLGAPGEPDYEGYDVNGEIKCWNRPMSKYDVMKEAKKGRDELISKRGFTNGAFKYTKRYRPYIRLIHGNKIVKRRQGKRKH